MTVEDRSPLNQVRYSGRDYPTEFDRLLRRLKDKYADDYNDFESTAQAIMLVDLTALSTSHLNWFLDRRASDSFLSTARTRGAVSRHTRQLGYKMNAATPSSADLTVSFEALVDPGTLPQGHQFEGPDARVFEAVADVALSIAQTQATVPVREGETRQLTFTSTGEKNQVFRLTNVNTDKFLSDGSVRVWVDGSEWEEKEFLEFDETDHFEADYNGEPPTVTFGDGVAGNIPPNASDILIEFVVISGADGNVNANTITRSISQLVINANTIALTVTNAEGSSGGNDPEELSSAKKFAPWSFASRGVTVTQPDYEALTNTFSDPEYGAPSSSYAIVVRDSSEDAQLLSLIDAITDLVAAHDAAMSSYETAIVSDSSDLVEAVADVTTARTEIDTQKADAESLNNGTLSSAQGIRGEAAVIGGAVDQINDLLADLQTEIDGAADVPTMTNLRSQISTLVANISGANSTITASGSTIESNSTGVGDDLTEIGVQSANIATAEATMTTKSSSILASASAMTTLTGQLVIDVDSAADDLRTYTTSLYDDDCKANVVSVPILALDANGFYVAPSSGLIQRLQDYLDEVKEVTQLVKVISGAPSLLDADIYVVVEVAEGYVASEVRANINSVIESLLKGRSFNQSLHLDTLYRQVRDNVTGYEHVNIEITGPTDYLDTEGNLIPGESKIVTKGTITITEAT